MLEIHVTPWLIQLQWNVTLVIKREGGQTKQDMEGKTIVGIICIPLPS